MEPRTTALTRRTVVAGTFALVAGCTSDGGSGDDEDDGNAESDDGESSGEANDTAGSGGEESDDGSDGSTDSENDTGGNETEDNETEDGEAIDPRGDVPRDGDLSLTSPAFEHGEQIPQRFGYDHENVNPRLDVTGIPDHAEALALLVDDPDAVEPAGQIWDHWLIWNIAPGTTSIIEGWEPDEPIEGTNDFGNVGYDGPSPPDGEHRYRFKLFALEATLDLEEGAEPEAFLDALDGAILAGTRLDGTYPAE